MGEEVESRVLLRCTSQLENALESDSDLAHYLNSEGYLKDDDYETVVNPTSALSRREKASLLVGGVKNKVALKPERYHDFVKHLRLNARKYGDIVSILDATYGKLARLASYNTIIANALDISISGEKIAYYKHLIVKSSNLRQSSEQKLMESDFFES